MQDSQRGDHPWALCACNLAELYYRVAEAIDFGAPVQFDNAVSRLE